MKTSSFLVLGVLLAGAGPIRSSLGGGKRPHFSDEVYGFTIDAPRFPEGPAKELTPVKFFGPREADGVTNVNVIVQKGKSARGPYLERSMAGLGRVGMKTLGHRDLTVSGHEAVEIDLQGAPAGAPHEVRMLQLAVFAPDRVILVTCTASAEAFRALEPELRACLSSLRLAPDGAAPPREPIRRSRYVDEANGYRIDVPRFRPLGKDERCRAVVFLGPPVEGFASNVVVTVGPPGSREKDREVSSAEFKEGLFKRIGERDLTVSGRDALEYDVERRESGERAYRLLTLTDFDEDRMYRVSCMAPADSFPAHEAEFRACLESLKLTSTKP